MSPLHFCADRIVAVRVIFWLLKWIFFFVSVKDWEMASGYLKQSRQKNQELSCIRQSDVSFFAMKEECRGCKDDGGKNTSKTTVGLCVRGINNKGIQHSNTPLMFHVCHLLFASLYSEYFYFSLSFLCASLHLLFWYVLSCPRLWLQFPQIVKLVSLQ